MIGKTYIMSISGSNSVEKNYAKITWVYCKTLYMDFRELTETFVCLAHCIRVDSSTNIYVGQVHLPF